RSDMPQVQRTSGVGGDDLDVHASSGEHVAAAVRRRGLDDGAGELTLGGRGDPEVEEPRTGDVDGFDAVTLTQPDGEELGQRTRIRAGLLGQLHGDVGGVVAVIAVARALDDDGGGHAVGQGDVAGLDSRREDVAHGGGQL